MIKLDYIIKRNESDEEKEYKPSDKIREIPSLSLVSGPNSSGKSSFLNFVAFALGASDSVLVSDNLKKKLGTVMTDEEYGHQETMMNLVIESGEDTYSFRKEYDNNNIVVKLNGKPLSRDSLHRKLDIIYDIPEAPTERLRGLTTTIESNQKRYQSKVEKIRDKLDKIETEIGESRNEEQISKYKENIKNDNAILEKTDKEIITKQIELDALIKYALLRELCKKEFELNKMMKEIETLEKDCKAHSRKKTKTDGKEKKCIDRYLGNIENNVRNSKDIMSSFVLESDAKFNYFLKHSIDDCFVTYEFDNQFEIITTEYKELLERERDKLKKRSKSIETENLVNEIINALKGSNSKLSIPGLDKTVGEILAVLNEVKSGFKNESHLKDEVENGIDIMSDILRDINTLNNELLPAYKEKAYKKEDDALIDVNVDRLEKKKKNYTTALDELKSFKKKSLANGISFELQEDEKKHIFEGIQSRSDSDEIKIKNFKVLEEMIERESLLLQNMRDNNERIRERNNRNIIYLEEAEKKEKHKYADREQAVAAAKKRCNAILRKMAKYDRYISDIEQGKKGKDDDFNEYNKIVSKYLGGLMGSVKHINKQYFTKSVDILNGKIESVDGKVILFSEIGTGQGQSAYLLSQLANLEKNDKKIVVLFDEIETMDRSSLEPIVSKLKELKESGKLIAGILVQKGDLVIEIKDLEA